ncbi:MAG TPA: diguanylate cyclase, partial [Lamprocystis sp. (in: g-proteobacteria)]|nr:diguanylate cyclase [Lamprocystis sp. (in: g-proteobacteria)]
DNLETVLLRKDGREIIALLSARIIRLRATPRLITVIRDISDLKRAEAAQRSIEELFSLFLHHSPIFTFIKEVTPTASRILQVSDNYHHMLGIPAKDLVGKTMADLFPPDFATMITADDRAVVASGEVLSRDEDFNGRHYTSIKFPILQGDRTLLAGYTIDITERRHLQDKLRQQATTDDLTGITNRRHFLDLAQIETRRALRHAHPLSLALLDIDHFKQINDVHGHAAGDQALLELTRICRGNMREIDVFARFGGDEFVALLPETGRAEARAVMDRVRLALAARQPVDLGGSPVAITISVGVASLARDGDSLDALLMRADQALYQAKNAGRNQVMTESAPE